MSIPGKHSCTHIPLPAFKVGTLSLRDIFGLPGGKKTEGTRIEVVLIESFRSPLNIEVRRFRQRIMDYASENPLEIASILFRYYDHEDTRVQKGVKACLMEISSSRKGMEGILENMIHPNRNVRKAVQTFLGEKIGAHAITYASFYEQTILFAAISKRKEVPVGDITALANLSKQTFMDGEVMQAVSDIGVCLDFIRHRLRSSEQLRNYVADLLKMAPDLTRMGTYNSAIEESLRKAMKASRCREFDETKDIIEERMRESTMRNRMYQFGRVVKESIYERPKTAPENMQDVDWEALAQTHDIVDATASLLMAGQKAEAAGILFTYIEEDLLPTYDSSWKERIKVKDAAALFTLYNIVIVLLKLTASVSPIAAEDAYQRDLRHLEGEPSIHLVMWPDIVMRMVDASQVSDDQGPPFEAAT